LKPAPIAGIGADAPIYPMSDLDSCLRRNGTKGDPIYISYHSFAIRGVEVQRWQGLFAGSYGFAEVRSHRSQRPPHCARILPLADSRAISQMLGHDLHSNEEV